ncbi:Quinolinate phosphoribosyl transferase [Obelidium mucronatum]|nr:Quinolinate phosphoribosyl transferase [Obelidium mucronatum]
MAVLTGVSVSDEELSTTLLPKLECYKACRANVTEFGTRRRLNQHSHFLISEIISNFDIVPPIYTSNVYLSLRNNTPPRGTCAHEWFMFFEAQSRLQEPTRFNPEALKKSICLALESWLSVYQSIFALTDVFTTPVFFTAYQQLSPSLQSRIHYRCDSGSELEYVDVIAATLHKLGLSIDEHLSSKMIMFSNSLNPSKVSEIQLFYEERITKAKAGGQTGVAAPKGVLFGVGTNFTNDLQYASLDLVIKLNRLLVGEEIGIGASGHGEGQVYAFKLSDVKAKFIGDESIRSQAFACVDSIEI